MNRTFIGVRGGSLALANTGEYVHAGRAIREHVRIVLFRMAFLWLFAEAPQKVEHGRTQDRMVLAAVRGAGHTKANFASTAACSPEFAMAWCNHAFRVEIVILSA